MGDFNLSYNLQDHWVDMGHVASLYDERFQRKVQVENPRPVKKVGKKKTENLDFLSKYWTKKIETFLVESALKNSNCRVK